MTTARSPVHGVLGCIADRAARTPHAVAVADRHDEWDYAQLWRAAGHTAAAIHAAGIGEQPVLLALRPGVRWLAGLLAIGRSGAIAVPIDTDQPLRRLTTLAVSCHAALTLTTSGEPVRWAQNLPSVPVQDGTASNPVEPNLHPGRAACVFFTSGSSGQPKPVVVGHAGLAERVQTMARVYDITAADRIAQLTSPAFDAMLWEVLPVLVRGGQIRIPSGAARVPGPELARWLAEQSITAFTCTPTVLTAIPFTDLPSVRLIVLGGEPLHPGPVGRWLSRYRVANAYGPTEATIEAVVAGRVLPGQHPVPIGRPYPGVGVRIVDQHGCPVPDGQVGELYLSGRGLALEYLGMPEETAAAFPVVDLGDGPHRYFRTGDLVRRLFDGQLTFVGRADRQLNLGGVRLEPGEIEACAVQFRGVRAAAATAMSRADSQPILTLHVAAGPAVTAQGLRRHLADHLPASAVPARIQLVDRLPHTISGKIDYTTLASTPHHTVEHKRVHRAPVVLPDPVLGWWRELTGTAAEHEAEFFAAGGTSVAALRLVSQINEEFGTDLTITAFLAEPTVEHLARVVAHSDTPSTSPVRKEEGQR